MDDREHARELLAILTRPVDQHDAGGDGIDRHDGFGTEVRVTSLDVVPGEHGEQIAVGFVLDAPPGAGAPLEGTVHLPFAAEWRAAQGLVTPQLHAPLVAREVLQGVRRHVSQHRGGPSQVSRLPDRDEQRQLLLEVLGREGDVEEVGRGRFVVRRPLRRSDLTVLVDEDDWEQVVATHGTRRSLLLEHFDELFGSKHPDDVFLVFWEGDLVGSVREQLPPVSARLRSLLAMQTAGAPTRAPGEDVGWFAFPPGSSGRELPGMESNHRR